MEEPAVERPCTSARQRARLGRSLTRMRVHLNSVAYTLSYRMMVGYSLRSASVNLHTPHTPGLALMVITHAPAAKDPPCSTLSLKAGASSHFAQEEYTRESFSESAGENKSKNDKERTCWGVTVGDRQLRCESKPLWHVDRR